MTRSLSMSDGTLFGEELPLAIPLALAFVGAGLAFLAVAEMMPPADVRTSTPRGKSPGALKAKGFTSHSALAGREGVVRTKVTVATKKMAKTPRSRPVLTTPATSTRPATGADGAGDHRRANSPSKSRGQPHPIRSAEKCAPLFGIGFLPGLARSQADFSAQGRALARWMKRHPDVTVDVLGYADASGSEYKNFVLSKKRAAFVVASLKKMGADPRRLRVRAFGEFAPPSKEASHNRWVEIAIPGYVACKGKEPLR